MMDSQDINAVLGGGPTQQWGMGGDPSFGQEFSASAMSGVAEIGLPAMGFGAAVGGWSAASKMGIDPVFGAPRAGWRMGAGLARTMGAGAIARTAVGGAGLGLGLATGMLPGMALDFGIRTVAGNLIEGAQSYGATTRFMAQIGQETSGFGSQSVLSGGASFQDAGEWAVQGGASALSAMGKDTELGMEGIMSLGGEMATSGMLGDVKSPQEFMSAFRKKLSKVKEMSKVLDLSLVEATQVMQQLQDAGLSDQGQSSLGIRAGTISGLTGQSLDTVMQSGMEGVQLGAQLGISADRSFQMGIQNLSATSVMAGLGAVDPRTLARYGGAQGLSQQLTQTTMQMGYTRGGQDFIRRLVNEDGTGFDMERLMGAVGGERRSSRRRVDPYAAEELQEDFIANERSIVLGHLGRLRAETDDDQKYNRQQFKFLQSMGIEDPRLQESYLQNLQAAPITDLLETGQRIHSDEEMAAEIRGRAKNAFSRFFDQIGDWMNEAVEQPIQRFGQRMARDFERIGESLSDTVFGRSGPEGGIITPDVAAIQSYAQDIWQGDWNRTFTRLDAARMLEESPGGEAGGGGGVFRSESRTGIASSLGVSDRSLVGWAAGADQRGQIDLQDMGVRLARTEEERRSMEGDGWYSMGRTEVGDEMVDMMATGRTQFALRMARSGIDVDPSTLQVRQANRGYERVFNTMLDMQGEEFLSALSESPDRVEQTIGVWMGLDEEQMGTPGMQATLRHLAQSARLPEGLRREREYRTIEEGVAAVTAEYTVAQLSGGDEALTGLLRGAMSTGRGRRGIGRVVAAEEAQRMFGGTNVFFRQSWGTGSATDEEIQDIMDRRAEALGGEDAPRGDGGRYFLNTMRRDIPESRAVARAWALDEVPTISLDNPLAWGVIGGGVDSGIPGAGIGTGRRDVDTDALERQNFRPIDVVFPRALVSDGITPRYPGGRPMDRGSEDQAHARVRTHRFYVPAEDSAINGAEVVTDPAERERRIVSFIERGREMDLSNDEMAFGLLTNGGLDPTDPTVLEAFDSLAGRSSSEEATVRRVLSSSDDPVAQELLSTFNFQTSRREASPEARERRRSRAINELRRDPDFGADISSALDSASEGPVTVGEVSALRREFEIMSGVLGPEGTREGIIQLYTAETTAALDMTPSQIEQFVGNMGDDFDITRFPALMDRMTHTQVEAVRARQFADSAYALREEGAQRLVRSNEFLTGGPDGGQAAFEELRETMEAEAERRGERPGTVTDAAVLDRLLNENPERANGENSYFQTGATGALELYRRFTGDADIGAVGREQTADQLVARETRESIAALSDDLSPEERERRIDAINASAPSRREDLISRWADVSFEDVMYGSAAAMAAEGGGLTQLDQELLSLLPGADQVMNLQTQIRDGDSDSISRVLTSMIGGTGRQQAFAESMNEENFSDVVERLQTEGTAGATFQDIVGKAISSGALSNQSLETFQERSMERKRDEALLSMSANIEAVTGTSGGQSGFRTFTGSGDVPIE